MAQLSDRERAELLDISRSDALRRDMRCVSEHVADMLCRDDEVNLVLFIEFLIGCNAFIGHEPRPFAPMIERVMKM